MANPLDVVALTPAELDRIEDALSDLGEGPLELPPETSSAVRARLEGYQAVLTLAREALPMVEVRPGLLDGVLAEAAASAPVVSADAPVGEGLWARLRRSFALPGLALAATAALLVMWLRPAPEDMSSEVATLTAGSARAEDAPAAAGGASPVEPAPTASPVIEAEEIAEDEVEGGEAKEAATPAAKPAKSAPGAAKPAPMKKSKSKLDDAFGAPAAAREAELPGVDPGDKASQREALDKADKLRRRGRCHEASAVYRSLEGVGGATEAQALVGLGLCAELQGDAGAAGALFTRARKLAAVDGLIDAGRKQMEGLKASKALE